ncbi:MAG: hypothetical protein GX458_14785 [Phyllobacteriaceae bacterium]|nr:hypothetical protein [Phyllobacteriaceae bacterium]
MSQQQQQSATPAPRTGNGKLPRGVAALALAVLAAVLCWQLLASTLAAAGAFVAAAVVAFLAWPVLVIRPAGASLGGAAATGALTLLAATVVAGLLLGRGGAVVVDHDTLILLLFSLWIVIPVMVAAAVGLALLDRRLSERDRGLD